MIAIDALDTLYEPMTQYPHKGELLPPTRLSVMEAFRVLDAKGSLRPEHRLARGVVLTAVTHHYTNIPSLFESVRACGRKALV
jgi:hypothetical protein